MAVNRLVARHSGGLSAFDADADTDFTSPSAPFRSAAAWTLGLDSATGFSMAWSATWSAPEYANSEFGVVGLSYGVPSAAFSETGESWDVGAVPLGEAGSIAGGDEKWIVVGSYSNDYAITTDSGASWATGTLPFGPTADPLQPIAHENGTWLVYRGGSTGYASTDGLSWSLFTLPPVYPSPAGRLMSAGGRFFILHYTPSLSGYIGFTSANGLSWSTVAFPGGYTPFVSNVWMFQGEYRSVSLSTDRFWDSTDGVTWADGNSWVPYPRFNLSNQRRSEVVIGPHQLFVSADSNGIYRRMMTSDDGSSWEIIDPGPTNVTSWVYAPAAARHYGWSVGMVRGRRGAG